MSNSKIRLKGRLRTYLQSTLLLGVLLALINVIIYFVSVGAGVLLTAFVIVYFIIVFLLMSYNKPIIMNELISFATQYGQIQKQLLRDLELPHALLDETGKIIWTNARFEAVVHKEKGYRKSITTLFPGLTREKLPGVEEATEETMEYEGNVYSVKMKKISLKAVYMWMESMY